MKYAGIAVVCALAVLAGCRNQKPEPKGRVVAPQVIRDIPSALKGTIGSEATLLKAEPVLVSGYGLVVGLPDTGGGDLDERLMATMERQLGLGGMSKASEALAGTDLEGMTPQQLLRSKKVAVVIVYATVVPGAPKGATFDVFVRAASASPDVSLEGGTLWTTDLQIGPATPVGGIKTRSIAQAYGPISINPFAEPGTRDGYTRRDGRILGGGMVTAPLKLELIRDNESHSRARMMTAAINNRFPAEPGGEQIARGESPKIVTVTVPVAYRERSQEFLQLLLHVQIDQGLPQEYAKKYVDALKSQPFLGDELSYCLQALPQKAAVPFLRELYDWPEMIPRLAGLRAGAGLGDPVAVAGLKQLATEASTSIRSDAIGLLGRLNTPTIDQTLKEFLTADQLPVRVAAYEALVDRAERAQRRRYMAQRVSMPAAVRVNLPEESVPGLFELTGDSVQGITRKVIEGRFILDRVPVGEPVIYITQQGRPRIVLFGENQDMKGPVLVSAWTNRLVLASDGPTDSFRLLYHPPPRMTPEGDVIPGRTLAGKVPSDIPGLLEYLAHAPTTEDPRPGLGLTYSEVVGALYAFQRGGAIPGTFAVEEDLLKARLLKVANQDTTEERPENPADAAEKLKVFEPAAPAATPEPGQWKPQIVPLELPKDPKAKKTP